MPMGGQPTGPKKETKAQNRSRFRPASPPGASAVVRSAQAEYGPVGPRSVGTHVGSELNDSCHEHDRAVHPGVLPRHHHEAVVHCEIQHDLRHKQPPILTVRNLEDKLQESFKGKEYEEDPREDAELNGVLFPLNEGEPPGTPRGDKSIRRLARARDARAGPGR